MKNIGRAVFIFGFLLAILFISPPALSNAKPPVGIVEIVGGADKRGLAAGVALMVVGWFIYYRGRQKQTHRLEQLPR